MPLNGRSFQSLIQLPPGVVVTASGQAAQGQFSVDGQRSNANYFTVDGVSVNFGSTTSVSLGQSFGGTLPALTISGGTNSFVSVDAMQEFRIQTSTYSPESGRSPGGQIAIVTKSGTNQFHGTAFDYLRNDIFDARNYFDQPPQPKPPTRQNDFGDHLKSSQATRVVPSLRVRRGGSADATETGANGRAPVLGVDASREPNPKVQSVPEESRSVLRTG
jgi:hypothetical protein